MKLRFFYTPKMALYFPVRIGYSAWNRGAFLNTFKPLIEYQEKKWWALWMRLGWRYWSIQLHT